MKTSNINFYRHLSLQVKALKIFGIWYYVPYSVNSVRFWATILCIIIIGISMFAIPTIAQILYLLRLITSGNSNILEITGIVNLILTEFVAEFRLLHMCLNRKKLSDLMEKMNHEEFQWLYGPQRNLCERAINISRWLFQTLIICASMDVFVHVVVVPAVEKFETLPLKMNFIFFDVYASNYFNYVFAYQILFKPWSVVAFTANQSFSWSAMLFTMSQLDVLIYNIENMKELVKSARAERNCDENEAFRQILEELVLHHSAIVRFIKMVQATFSGQLSIYLFVSTTIIGSTALQFFSIKSPTHNLTDVIWLFAYMAIFVGMLFIDCYLGNCITTKCEKLSTCIFFCPWLDVNTKLKRNVAIFIAKTQLPVKITATKLIPVSLETFTKVMNWTYKGFAVMNQMK